jgi:hypothetical protein
MVVYNTVYQFLSNIDDTMTCDLCLFGFLGDHLERFVLCFPPYYFLPTTSLYKEYL